MRHDPAGASIVIMLRSLKLYGMANAIEDLVAQGAPAFRFGFVDKGAPALPAVVVDAAEEQLALVETLAIGCHATDRGAPEKGDHVLIIGTGPIGLATLEFTRLTGAKITVMDMVESRLQFTHHRRQLAVGEVHGRDVDRYAQVVTLRSPRGLLLRPGSSRKTGPSASATLRLPLPGSDHGSCHGSALLPAERSG